MKTTAVEWLIGELEDNGINLDLASELIEQAKEMEREQQGYSKEDIKLAFTEGHNSARLRGSYKFNGTFEEDWNEWLKQFKNK